MYRVLFFLTCTASTIGYAQAAGPQRLAAGHLPNLVQVHSRVLSGGLPADVAAFRELRQLGVKTIISVDGAKPDVKMAAEFGLRYVHLPHGYGGVPRGRVLELAKAVRELEGPIYIHCHHGKHRSPAAASVACVAAGMLSRAEGLFVLTLAGTSPNYRGLYESVREAKPVEVALLDKLDVVYRETVEVPPLAEAMVALGHTHDHLKAIAAAGWQTPAEHPDLEPAHEVLLLREHFTELLRAGYVQEAPEAFKKLLRDSEQTAEALENALREWEAAETKVAPPALLADFTQSIKASCKACHQQFRDVPLSEK